MSMADLLKAWKNVTKFLTHLLQEELLLVPVEVQNVTREYLLSEVRLLGLEPKVLEMEACSFARHF